MASDVDICNLALGHLGDTATVASIDPPEGSAQSEHCARFYPMARDSLLEMHAWNFATRRAQLALLSSAWPEWAYCYALPAEVLNILAILPPDASNDYSETFNITNVWGVTSNYPPFPGVGQYVPQAFSNETLDDGTAVVYTNQVDAVMRYTARVTDPSKFSPLFVQALSWHLAAVLAGPLIKGDAGAAEAKRCTAMAQAWLAKAAESDANQRRINVQQVTPWMSGR